MPSTPEAQITEMMAESRLRQQSMARIHSERIKRIPAQLQVMSEERDELVLHIREVGVGHDEQAENRYLQLLEQIRILEESQEQHELSGGGTAAENKEPVPSALKKALAYGELLLAVYSPGVLVKGASADIEAAVRRLERYQQSAEAVELADRLRAIACG